MKPDKFRNISLHAYSNLETLYDFKGSYFVKDSTVKVFVKK